MRVLVTGGAGFIGSHTTDRLIERGHEVRVLDSLELPVHQTGAPAYLAPEVEFIHGDVTQRQDLLAALDGIEAVYHFAAYQDYLPDFSRFFQVNAAGTALLYELAVEHEIPLKKIVTASSQAVAGEGRYRCESKHEFVPDMRSEATLRAGRYDHDCPTCGSPASWNPTDTAVAQPQSAYGLSKHAQERIALSLGARYDIPSVAMRYSIVQGPRQSPHNAYSGACRVFCLSFLSDQEPPIYEDGQQIRDFVNIHDVIDANLLVLENDEANGRVFNVGGGRAYTVAEFARITASAFGRDYEPTPSGRYRFGDTRHIFSDCSELRGLGWEPKRDAAHSVAEYVNWLREQDDLDDILDRANQRMQQLGVVREIET
ncbi:SDR family NAD(P)-dependent oxidoreductase [Myxococcota bacterium]|nr:SDR family NAD(P)-dependent oxidoreductase [Myxococcota bacterium]